MSPAAPNDDEIDLFELFETLWREKILILALTISALFLGFAYAASQTSEFRVSSDFVVDVGCGYNSNSNCNWKNFANFKLEQQLPEHWSVDGSTVTFLTQNPKSEELYFDELKTVSETVNKISVAALESEIDAVKDQIENEISSSEFLAAKLYEADRFKRLINAGSPPIKFENISIQEIKPKTRLIAALSLVLGLFCGCGIVLLRQAIKNRQMQT